MPPLKCRTVRSALTRLAILFGVSLMLFVSSESGVALAGNGCNHATNPAQCQYTEVVTIIRHRKHSGGTTHRNTATNPTRPTNSPGSSETTSTRAQTTSTVRTIKGRHRRHKPHGHRKSHKPPVQHGSTPGRGGHALASKPTQGVTGLNTAAATGSGGGMGIWLPVILALVLVGGSAAGILRYRHNR